MTSPYPTPWQAYDQLPYHFPLVDEQPVVTVPVAGPAPYDTVAVVRTVVPVTNYGWSGGELHRRRLEFGTPLVVPRAVGGPAPVHSSSASLRMIQISAESDVIADDDNTDFVLAVDGVDPVSRFDASGRWCVTVDLAEQMWQVYAGATAEISSWVLFRTGPQRQDDDAIDPYAEIPGLPWRFPGMQGEP